MCEKAFVANYQDSRSRTAVIDATWPNVNRGLTKGTVAQLPMMLMHKMLRADSADDPVFRLHSEPREIRSGFLIDTKPAVDSLAIHSAVQSHGFETEALCASENVCCFLGRLLPDDLGSFIDKAFTGGLNKLYGIWPHFSMINHACDANSIHSHMGDLMIIRAAKDIEKGDEITIIYEHRVDGDPRKLWETLAFRCQCAACKAHDQCPDRKLDERRDRIQEFSEDYSSLIRASMFPRKDNTDSVSGK